MKLADIVVVVEGPVATHNYPCPVYRDEVAVLDLSTGIMQPSWTAQADGYVTVRAYGWRRWILKWLDLV